MPQLPGFLGRESSSRVRLAAVRQSAARCTSGCTRGTRCSFWGTSRHATAWRAAARRACWGAATRCTSRLAALGCELGLRVRRRQLKSRAEFKTAWTRARNVGGQLQVAGSKDSQSASRRTWLPQKSFRDSFSFQVVALHS